MASLFAVSRRSPVPTLESVIVPIRVRPKSPALGGAALIRLIRSRSSLARNVSSGLSGSADLVLEVENRQATGGRDLELPPAELVA